MRRPRYCGVFLRRNGCYELFDVPTAIAQTVAAAKRLRKRGRQLYAYGESAGGDLAALLAERGLAQAAAVQSSVVDLVAFINGYPDPSFIYALLKLNPQTAAKYSANRHRSKRRIVAFTGTTDPFAGPTPAWAASDPEVRAVQYPGGHLDPGTYAANLTQAMDFLSWQHDLAVSRTHTGSHPGH